MEANFVLYNEAIKLNHELSFSDFQTQSSILLKSFNDVEINLINHNKLFNELNNISELENWSLNEKDLSKNQKKIHISVKKTGLLFQEFKKKLILEKKNFRINQ